MDYDKIIYPAIMLSQTTQERKQNGEHFRTQRWEGDVDLRKRRKQED
jgi:hypothetical protein